MYNYGFLTPGYLNNFVSKKSYAQYGAAKKNRGSTVILRNLL